MSKIGLGQFFKEHYSFIFGGTSCSYLRTKLFFDSFLILEHFIRHKQISSNKTAFNVDEALSIVLACKLPLFDQSALEGGTYVFIYTILRFFLNFNNMLYV